MHTRIHTCMYVCIHIGPAQEEVKAGGLAGLLRAYIDYSVILYYMI